MLPFQLLKKNLKKDYSGFKKVKVALLSDNASQFLNTALRAWGYECRLDLDIYEADFNQIDLQVFDPNSGLYAFSPEFIFINRSTEKLLNQFYKLDRGGQQDFALSLTQKMQQYLATLAARLPAKVITNTIPELDDSVFGNFATRTPGSFVYQLRKANLMLMELAQQSSGLFLCDLALQQSTVGRAVVHDPKLYINADMAYGIDFLPHIAKQVTDIILSITGTFKKCLILDLDNTTWGGIIGDDGMDGIQVGHLGMGKVYTELQLWAKQLKQRGIILAVCSKNTEEIAMEPFDKHPDMVLRMDDIAVFVANWSTKVENIRYIQSVLNIGFDSMVFVDDNPFEREMVRAGIPDVTVPELPEDPAEYLSFLRSLNLWETASFTEEDELRTKQYKEEAQRNILLQKFDNEHDFLASLEMVSEVKPFDSYSIPRVAQLTQRSNQFNLRTIRYTDDDIKRIASDTEYFTCSLTLADRFGDHGLIGLVILRKETEKRLFIDTWIMSCRVLKRGMENFTLNTIARLARFHNFEQLIGEYLPTRKNGIVKDHYQDLGFAADNGRWILDLNTFEPENTFITYKNEHNDF